MDESENRLGRRIRELREAAGMNSQKKLADKARLSQGYLSQLEKGVRRSASPEITKRLARALNVPTSELASLMPDGVAAAIGGRNLIPLIGVVSAGDGVEDAYSPDTTLSVSGLFPPGTVAYLVQGTSMVDAHVCDGDYILVRPKPQAEPGEIVVVWVPDMGTVVKLKRKKHYASANDRQPREPIPSDGCREYGVLVGIIRKY